MKELSISELEVVSAGFQYGLLPRSTFTWNPIGSMLGGHLENPFPNMIP